MGTSTRNKGQNGHNPLIPTWLDDEPNPDEQENADDGEIEDNENIEEQDDDTLLDDNQLLSLIPSDADPYRFKEPRSLFTRFISDGGRDNSLMKHGISKYIRSSLRGSSNAVKRLGSSRASTAKLFFILNKLTNTDDLKDFAVSQSLEGLSASDFFISLSQFICPDGGMDNEGISRSAYYDTIVDNPQLMEKDTKELSKDDINLILQNYMSKVVMQQIMNAIANKTISLSENLDEIARIEDAVEQLINQSVSDAIAQVNQNNSTLTKSKARKITDSIYQKTFEILEKAGE